MELLRALMQLSEKLYCFVLLCYRFWLAALPYTAHSEMPVFSGFQDDANVWVVTINALRLCHALPKNKKWLVAINCLQGAAEA